MSSRIHRWAGLFLAAAVLPASNCEGDTGGGQTIDRLTIRLSVSVNLTQALGNSNLTSSQAGFAAGQCVSADGRFVAFESSAQNLTTDDPNTTKDVFVKDRVTGVVERVSVKTSGPLFGPALDSLMPAISPDGRYVVWVSAGDYSGSTNGSMQPYVHDRLSGLTRPVLNSMLNADAVNPSIATDAGGRLLVAFVSQADAVAGYTGGAGFRKVWVADITGVNAVVVQLSAVGTAGVDAHNSVPRFSADGSLVTFMSESDTLHIDDPDTDEDVYIADPDGGPPGGPTNAAPELVSRRDDNDQKIAAASRSAWPSANGRYVVFSTSGDIGNGMGSLGSDQVVRRDRQAGTTTLLSTTQAGVIGNSGSGFPSVSADGMIVAFSTSSSNLATLVLTSSNQMCVRLPDGTIRQVTVNQDGDPAEFLFRAPVVSGDGRWAYFHTASSNLVPGDTNGSEDVFAHGPLQ